MSIDSPPYKRWVPDDFGASKVSAHHKPVPKPQITPEQLAEEARLAGYEAGFAEGKVAGMQQGQVEIDQQVAHLQQLINAVGEEITRFEEAQKSAQDAYGQALVSLALEVARQMLRQTLQVKPELIIPIISDALEALPQDARDIKLYLHPMDNALLVQHPEFTVLGRLKIEEDSALQRGGFRIETQTGELDATIENRWTRIAEALGQDSSWLVMS